MLYFLNRNIIFLFIYFLIFIFKFHSLPFLLPFFSFHSVLKTIIECLKYATTGDMPPNCRSGQAFIHDTRIAGEREVKAQVKLKFTKANGKPVVVTRSLLLTQKAQRQEYKTLDSIVQTYTDKNEVFFLLPYFPQKFDHLICFISLFLFDAH